MADRGELEARYLALVRETLPATARERGWRLRFDHCFARIVLDHVFGRCWYEALDRRRPAYRQLTDAQLERAIELALALPSDLDAMDARSLAWRGKPPKRAR